MSLKQEGSLRFCCLKRQAQAPLSMSPFPLEGRILHDFIKSARSLHRSHQPPVQMTERVLTSDTLRQQLDMLQAQHEADLDRWVELLQDAEALKTMHRQN